MAKQILGNIPVEEALLTAHGHCGETLITQIGAVDYNPPPLPYRIAGAFWGDYIPGSSFEGTYIVIKDFGLKQMGTAPTGGTPPLGPFMVGFLAGTPGVSQIVVTRYPLGELWQLHSVFGYGNVLRNWDLLVLIGNLDAPLGVLYRVDKALIVRKAFTIVS